MSKLNLDKYYTEDSVVLKCLNIAAKTLFSEIISEAIEPSAGNGAFSNKIKNCIAYDIEPEHEDIIQQDFLELDLDYKKGRLIIGNPPFGKSNSLSVKFFKKSIQIADYIAFILPISQLNNTLQMYEFDLISSTDLGEEIYTDRKLHCCFNIYKRPISGLLNDKPDYKLKDVTIKEFRRGGTYIIQSEADLSICNWGNGSLGKVPSFVGEYAQEAYIYVHNKKYLEQIRRLFDFETIRKYVSSISMKRISVARLYKYIKDNIPEIE